MIGLGACIAIVSSGVVVGLLGLFLFSDQIARGVTDSRSGTKDVVRFEI